MTGSRERSTAESEQKAKEKDKMTRAYTHLAKQNGHCRRCLQRLDTNDQSLPIVPIEIETRQDTEIPLVKDPRDFYLRYSSTSQ